MHSANQTKKTVGPQLIDTLFIHNIKKFLEIKYGISC